MHWWVWALIVAGIAVLAVAAFIGFWVWLAVKSQDNAV